MEARRPDDNDLAVFLARGRMSHGIRQTLEDFSASGLIQDLAWVDADTFTSSSSEVTYVRLDAEGTPRISREPFNALVAHTGIDTLHLGVINVVGAEDGEIGSAQLAALSGAIDSVLTGRGIQRTNLMLAAVDSPLDGDMPVLRGFTNLMLAPEDSKGPEAATVPYHSGDLDGMFTLHCAAGIMSLFGLWEGSTEVPVTRLEPAAGGTFRLVRAFYRRVDGQEVQARLKARVFDTGNNPLPRLRRPGQEVTAQYTEDPRAFAQGAADDLLSEFREVLDGPTSRAMRQKTRQGTAGSAIREFFSLWVQFMVSTPVRFFRELSGEARTFVDDTVQSAVYGTDSRTQVGARVVVAEQQEAAGGQVPRPESLRVRAAQELAPVWRSYAYTALSLLDAAPRRITDRAGEIVLPRVVSEHAEAPVWVAQRAADVIPGPDSHFGRDLPVEVRATVGGGDIAPYDLRGVAEYERTLSDQRTGSQREVGRVIGDFKQWQEENSGSFAHCVGRGLAEKHAHLVRRRQDLERQLHSLEEQDPEVETNGFTAVLFRWLGWVTMTSLLVFAVAWGVGNVRAEYFDAPMWDWVANLNAAPVSTKWKLFGGWTALWMVFWAVQVAAESVAVIRFRHRRGDVVTDRQALEANVVEAATAIERLDVGYRQFLSTSRMIGALIERPFGRMSTPRVDSTIPMNTMPDSVVFAEATPGADAVEDLANAYRRDMYREGWLGDFVDHALTEAFHSVEENTAARGALTDMFATSGQGTHGQLARVAEVVTGDAFRNRDRSTGEWARITSQLRDDTDHGDAGILTPLEIYRDGRRRTANPRRPLEDVRTIGSFNGEIATEHGRVTGMLDLDPEFCIHDRAGSSFDAIGVSEVLVQVGQPAVQDSVAFRRPTPQPLSPDLVRGMPTGEDFPVQGQQVLSAPAPKHHLPGTGEF